MKFLAFLVPLALLPQVLAASVYLTVYERSVPWVGRKSDYAGEEFWRHLRIIKKDMRRAFDNLEIPTSSYTLRFMTRPDALGAKLGDGDVFRCDVRCRMLVLSREPLASIASVPVTAQALLIGAPGTRGHAIAIPPRFSLLGSIWRATDNGVTVIRIAPELRAALAARIRREVRFEANARSVQVELRIGTADDEITVELGKWSVPGFKKEFFLERSGLNLFYWLNRCRSALE